MKSSLPLHHIVAKPQSCIGEQCAPALCRGFFMYTGVHECTRHFRHKNAPNCENSGRFVYIFVYAFRKSLTLNVYCGEGGIRTPGTVARTPHFECGPIDHSGTSPFRSREEGLPRSPDPKPLFWDCKYRHIFYFRTFSCGKNHIWLKKRLRRPCFCRFSGIIRIFDFVRRYARAAKCRQVCFCFRRFVSLQTDGPASRMQYFPCAAVYKEERY